MTDQIGESGSSFLLVNIILKSYKTKLIFKLFLLQTSFNSL